MYLRTVVNTARAARQHFSCVVYWCSVINDVTMVSSLMTPLVWQHACLCYLCVSWRGSQSLQVRHCCSSRHTSQRDFFHSFTQLILYCHILQALFSRSILYLPSFSISEIFAFFDFPMPRFPFWHVQRVLNSKDVVVCYWRHMLSGSWQQQHLLNVDALCRRQMWSMDSVS